MSGKETILVGVDGSPESLEAAEWAGARAQQSGSKLQVLCAYALPSYTAASMDSGFAVVDNDAIRESAQTVVDEAMRPKGGWRPVIPPRFWCNCRRKSI